jgi:hypothetical protein
VQFEGYIPAKPELKHQYDSTQRTTVGGLDFIVDTWARARDEKMTPGSDLEHLRAMIEAKGCKLSAGMMLVRLVHLLNEQKRRELMIIYAEDLAPTGFAAADLQIGGKARDQWSAIEKGLIDRAKERIAITQF